MYSFFDRLGLPGKAVVTLLLSALAVSLYLTRQNAASYYCMLAMLLSSAGDFSLMRKSPSGETAPIRLLLAIACFMAAHFRYIAACLSAAAAARLTASSTGFFCAVALLGAAFLSLLYFLVRTKIKPVWMLAGALYLLTVGADCIAIFCYAFAAGGLTMLCALGFLLFFLSDYMIGLRLLRAVPSMTREQSERLVWWLYPIGQCLMLVFLR